ncbi:MAG: HD-GYP domain-containing protein [Chitinophagales bacterium]
MLDLKLTAAARHVMLSNFSGSRVLVFDRRGHIVIDTRHGATAVVDGQGAPAPAESISIRLRQVLTGSEEEGFFRDFPPGDNSGDKDLVTFARLPSTGWTVVAFLGPEVLSRQFGLFVRGWLFMSLGTVLALLLLTLVFVDRLLLPIERLFRLTRESRFLGTEVAVTDDLLVLTRSVNRLMAYIEAFPGVLNLMLGLKDGYTSYHTRAVALYAVEIGKELGLTERQLGELECAALLHDIGKAGVPDGILKKPAGLTDDEWASIRLHPVIGSEVAAEAGFAPSITHAIRQHHERLDGSGYPDRLEGEKIGFYARIIAVADSYHAMTSNRPYRPAKRSEEALDELARLSTVKYDRRVVEAFAAVLRRLPGGYAELHDAGISEPSSA